MRRRGEQTNKQTNKRKEVQGAKAVLATHTTDHKCTTIGHTGLQNNAGVAIARGGHFVYSAHHIFSFPSQLIRITKSSWPKP